LGIPWTEEEEEILSRNYVYCKAGSAKYCAALLKGRTVGAIYDHAKVLKHGRVSSGNQRTWKRREIEYLERYTGVLDIQEIADRLKRSVKSVRSYAERNGMVRFADHDGYFNAREAATVFGVSETWVSDRVKNGLIGNGRERQSNQHYYIKTRELKTFIRTYPAVIDDLVRQGKKPDMIYLIEILAGILAPRNKTGEVGAPVITG